MPDYDAATALIVVDVQNDFADPSGSLYVAEGDLIVDPVNREVARAQEAGAVVAYTQDWHPPATPHFVTGGGTWPVHCVRDTWGAELHPRLAVAPGSELVRKGVGGEDGYSGFTVRHPETGAESPTGLEDRLRSAGVERAVVVGLATDVCVKETVLDAVRAGFATEVLADATRPVELSNGDGERAITEMAEAGARIG